MANGGWNAQRRSEFAAQYVALIEPYDRRADLSALDIADIEMLFSAANLVSFYATANHVNDLRRFLDELQTRGHVADANYRYMYEAYVRARQFDRARALAVLHPEVELEALPEVRDPIGARQVGPTQLVVDDERIALERQAVHLERGVLVVFHPDCHFSQNAVAVIETDPVLAGLFREQAQWVAPPSGRIEFDRFRSWITEHTSQRVGIAWNASEWGSFDLTSTPVFYFVDQGKTVATVTGWPAEGRRDELLAAARRARLLP